MPAPRGLQDIEGLGGRTLGGAADGELHDHDGQAQNDEEDEIHQDEGRAAVFAGDVGEAPHVAQAVAQPAEMRMKPRRLAKCSRGAATEVGASTLLPEARTGEAEGVSVVMGTFLVQDSRCFCIGLPSVLNEIAASL